MQRSTAIRTLSFAVSLHCPCFASFDEEFRTLPFKRNMVHRTLLQICKNNFNRFHLRAGIVGYFQTPQVTKSFTARCCFQGTLLLAQPTLQEGQSLQLGIHLGLQFSLLLSQERKLIQRVNRVLVVFSTPPVVNFLWFFSLYERDGQLLTKNRPGFIVMLLETWSRYSSRRPVFFILLMLTPNSFSAQV